MLECHLVFKPFMSEHYASRYDSCIDTTSLLVLPNNIIDDQSTKKMLNLKHHPLISYSITGRYFIRQTSFVVSNELLWFWLYWTHCGDSVINIKLRQAITRVFPKTRATNLSSALHFLYNIIRRSTQDHCKTKLKEISKMIQYFKF